MKIVESCGASTPIPARPVVRRYGDSAIKNHGNGQGDVVVGHFLDKRDPGGGGPRRGHPPLLRPHGQEGLDA